MPTFEEPYMRQQQMEHIRNLSMPRWLYDAGFPTSPMQPQKETTLEKPIRRAVTVAEPEDVKVVTPADDELVYNPRSRSAKLRVVAKIKTNKEGDVNADSG